LYTSSVNRITGMATGLDTESIVNKLMSVESLSLNRLKQQQQKQIWMSDAFRQWNKDFFTFQQNTLFNMKLSSSYNVFDVASSQSSAVSGTGTSSAIAGTYTINSVDSIAKSATFTGDVKIGRTEQAVTAETLISINVISDPKNPTVSQTATIKVEAGATIDTIVSSFNKATDDNGKSLGIQAYYDSALNQFIVKTKATGAATEIDFSANVGNSESEALLQKLGITLTDDPSTTVVEKPSQSGQDASFLFDGKQVTSSSNNVTVMGISLTLKNTATEASTITVSKNIDTEIKNIKDFVEKYNDMLDKLNKVYDEAVYRDYQPLLDEQKDGMSEKQVEMWEEKAKSGLLRRDSIISEVIGKMRSAMGSIITNGSDYNSLASIGISSKSYQDKGKLYIDEKKLRDAIQADPDGVVNLFSQIGDTEQGTNGLVNRLSDIMSDGMKALSKKAGSSGSSYYDQSVIGKLLSNIQSNITRQTDILTNKENQYYKQFAAMEAAVAKFNSQGSWLYQQMGG
jgi:flagellar hook-associated protein 2